jgi:hypothetical protein
MQLILRTHEYQAKLEGQPSITDRENDFSVVVDGPQIGRIYLEQGGPSNGKWFWFLQVSLYRKGMADTLDEAKDEIAKCWHLTSGK